MTVFKCRLITTASQYPRLCYFVRVAWNVASGSTINFTLSSLAMKPYPHSPYVGTARLLFTTTFMLLAGVIAWWGWTHVALGGLGFALIGAIIVVVAAPFILVWFRKNTAS